jgi:hypothetical protein
VLCVETLIGSQLSRHSWLLVGHLFYTQTAHQQQVLKLALKPRLSYKIQLHQGLMVLFVFAAISSLILATFASARPCTASLAPSSWVSTTKQYLARQGICKACSPSSQDTCKSAPHCNNATKTTTCKAKLDANGCIA